MSIWGIEGRHLWVPPGVDLSPAAAAIFPYGITTLYEYILSLDPLLYWPLNAAHGVTDQSGNGLDGTVHGGVTLGGAASLTADTTDSATNFDGSNDYISSAYTPSGSTTIIGIAELDVITGNHALWSTTSAGSHADEVIFAGTIDGAMRSAGLGALTFGPWVAASEIATFGMTMRSTAQMKSYLNGALTGSGNDLTFSAPGTFQVGAYAAAPAAFWDGSMAHVAAFGRELSAGEMELFNFFAGPDVPLLVQLNRRRDDDGVPVYPRYFVDKTSGLRGTGDSRDTRDGRVGGPGEIPRQSFRSGKTITYEGLVQARSHDDLRDAEEALVTAFDDQSDEGLMVVTPHPSYASGYRYFPAKALAAEVDDEAKYSPSRPTAGHENAFVVSVRNARAGGISYTDQDGNTYK